MRGIVVSTFVACLCWPHLLLAALPEGLAGAWRGSVEIDGTEAEFRAALADRDDGFEVDLRVPGAAPLQARFVPTDRPQVFEAAAPGRGLFSFFDGGDRSNPFDGAPLIWARASAVGIVAYRLAIAEDGGMELLRIAIESIEGQVEVSIEERIDARRPMRLRAMLEPAG